MYTVFVYNNYKHEVILQTDDLEEAERVRDDLKKKNEYEEVILLDHDKFIGWFFTIVNVIVFFLILYVYFH